MIAEDIKFLQEKLQECRKALCEAKLNPMPNIDDIKKFEENLKYYTEKARELEMKLGMKGKIFPGIWN